ncbi:fasciclin domain-containing protein [Flavobacterium sp. D11R37]|uniref:fasciclin domain-containing protein n=1 Tax=Flavobacterium coralii TaxID=2838017 RepID=UPI001CA72D39|nr:fasciclin domain-containing protein [Flavobacterium coralii]MBY8963992.1 fasciclin domain-containing protein [Flavobacterium coralii]
MKINFLTKTAAIMAFAVAQFVTSCSSDDDNNNNNQPDNTIVDIAAADQNFSILVQALDRAGLVATLDGDTEFTVFAPTDAAFDAFLDAKGFETVNDVPVAVLREILLNHVVSGTVMSSSLQTGYVKTLAKGSASSTNTLSMFINTASGVVINGGAANGGATVTSADIEASNGVIHVVNSVIDLPTVVNHAIANPAFSILVQALTRDDQPDFVGTLSGTANSPFTVFAPTDAAFVALLDELSLETLNDVPQATLQNALSYHVVTEANVLAATLTDNMSVTTFQGGSFTVNLEGGASITDANDRVSNIIVTDVQASNGVVHAIDKVLLP